jgi:hypothetical protein
MPPNSRDFIKKGKKIFTKEGGLGQNPQKETERKKIRKQKHPKNRLRKYVVGKPHLSRKKMFMRHI